MPEPANSRSFAVAVVEALSLRGDGVESWAAGIVPAELDGYIEYIGVIAVCAGRPRVMAVAYSLDPLGVCTIVPADRAGGVQLVHRRGAVDRESAALADEILAWHEAHPDDTNVLDAAFRIRFALTESTPEAGSIWYVSTSSDERAWTSVEIGTADHDHCSLVYLEQVDKAGVSLRLTGPGPVLEATLRTPADLESALPSIVAGVRERIADRARFRSRPFRAGEAARAIADALTAADGGHWQWRAADGAWPSPAPWAAVFQGSEEHTVATLSERDGSVHISAGVIDGRPSQPLELAVADQSALSPALPAIAEAVARRLSRLTPDRLEPGRSYRALASLGEPPLFIPGDRYRLEQRQYIPYDGCTLYTFRAASGPPVHVRDTDDQAQPLFRDLDLYLREDR